jgi:hypothetical protein
MNEEFWSARVRTACLMFLVFAQFQDRWGGYGGAIALLTCTTWACLPGIIAEWSHGKMHE